MTDYDRWLTTEPEPRYTWTCPECGEEVGCWTKRQLVDATCPACADCEPIEPQDPDPETPTDHEPPNQTPQDQTAAP